MNQPRAGRPAIRTLNHYTLREALRAALLAVTDAMGSRDRTAGGRAVQRTVRTALRLGRASRPLPAARPLVECLGAIVAVYANSHGPRLRARRAVGGEFAALLEALLV